MLKEHDIELVEQFLEGNLEGDELKSFKEREASDPEFARFIKVRLMIGDAWTSASNYIEAKQWVSSTIDKHIKVKSRVKRRNTWFSLAAMIIILLGVYIIMKFGFNSGDDQPSFASDTTLIEINQGIPQDEKANIDTVSYIPGLLAPPHNTSFPLTDSVEFKWEPGETVNFMLCICLAKNDSIVFTVPFENKETKYILEPGQLGAGEYYWYLDYPEYKGHFKIIGE